jgi:hypothetical protein
MLVQNLLDDIIWIDYNMKQTTPSRNCLFLFKRKMTKEKSNYFDINTWFPKSECALYGHLDFYACLLLNKRIKKTWSLVLDI